MRQLIFSLLLANLIQAEDWPNWRGPRHDGISREAMPKADFSKIAWRAKIGVGFSSMAVADGRVFALGCTGKRRGNEETFTCLDAATGKKIWSDTYTAALVDYLHEGGPCASPTVDGKRVYGYSKSGRLACYNVTDGEKYWTADLMAKAGLPKPPYRQGTVGNRKATQFVQGQLGRWRRSPASSRCGCRVATRSC